MRVSRNPGRTGCAAVIERWTTNRASTPGKSRQPGNDRSPEASSSAASDREGSASRTPKSTRSPESARRVAVTPKEARMPTRSANTPPTKGPAAEATKTNVWRVPSLEEALSGGAVAETSTVAAATVPVSEPCNNLRSRSCQGDVTSPIKPSITDPASVLDPEPLYVERQKGHDEHEPRCCRELRDQQDPER